MVLFEFQVLGYEMGALYHVVFLDILHRETHDILVRPTYPRGFHWWDEVYFHILAALRADFYPLIQFQNGESWKSPEKNRIKSMTRVAMEDLPLFVGWAQLSSEFQKMLTSQDN